MRKIDKKIEKKINKTIENTLKNALPHFDFDSQNTVLDFICDSCKAKYSYDVMAIYFDTLKNREKLLATPICPVCGEKEKYSYQDKSLHFLSFLFKEGHMLPALLQEKYMKEFHDLYPEEKTDNFRALDEKGLEAFDRGDYDSVYRIFMQFIYMNPIHHLGFEFIAYALYEERKFDKALYFMEKALERIELALSEETLDKGLYSVIKKNYEYMKRKQLITRWWENL